jgi:hypothetical protein
MGNWYFDGEKVPNTPTYLMQHNLYGRLGKPGWKLKLYSGFNHQVVWGNEKHILYGEDYELNGWQTFIYVNTAKAYNNGIIQDTRIGNHLGSIDLGATYDLNKIEVFIYRQFVYDAGALYYLANLRDGLSGLSITHRNSSSKPIQWQKLVFEFLYTTAIIKSDGLTGEMWLATRLSVRPGHLRRDYP